MYIFNLIIRGSSLTGIISSKNGFFKAGIGVRVKGYFQLSKWVHFFLLFFLYFRSNIGLFPAFFKNGWFGVEKLMTGFEYCLYLLTIQWNKTLNARFFELRTCYKINNNEILYNVSQQCYIQVQIIYWWVFRDL